MADHPIPVFRCPLCACHRPIIGNTTLLVDGVRRRVCFLHDSPARPPTEVKKEAAAAIRAKFGVKPCA